MTYIELLSTTERKDKRISILIRYKHECKQCKNKSYLRESKIGRITEGELVNQVGDYINKTRFI